MKNFENIRKLQICGVFKSYPWIAGMYILKTERREEAEDICKSEPQVMEEYATYKLVALQITDLENNYLL